MEKLLETDKIFETGKKASKKRPVGWALRLLRFLFNLVLVIVSAALIVVSGLYGYVIYAYGDQLDRTYPDLAQNSSVYDENGDRMGEFKAEEDRQTVGPEGLGEYLPQAAVAVEDRWFYDHWGMDVTGVSRAAWEDLRALAVNQVGSTITEQLVKNLYISEEQRASASPWRRFQQAALSFAYERRHTKEEILTAYLNTVYLGDGAYGAEEAAKKYFGKSASNLSLGEGATLAGFLHAPSTYLSNDGEGTELATERRNDVLERMEEQGMISEEVSQTEGQPLEFAPDPTPPEDPAYKPFMEAVRREVENKLGPDAVKEGGLEIHTTLDPGLQQNAVSSIDET